MKIVLIRHFAPLIQPGICYGRLDIPTCSKPAEDAALLARNPALLGASHIWTSPARRCRELADALAPALTATVSADLRLLELDFGAWEGKAWDDIARSDLDAWAESPWTFAAPDGESAAALVARIRDFYADLVKSRQDSVIVSHGGPLRVLAALLDQKPVDLFARPPAFGTTNLFVLSPDRPL